MIRIRNLKKDTQWRIICYNRCCRYEVGIRALKEELDQRYNKSISAKFTVTKYEASLWCDIYTYNWLHFHGWNRKSSFVTLMIFALTGNMGKESIFFFIKTLIIITKFTYEYDKESTYFLNLSSFSGCHLTTDVHIKTTNMHQNLQYAHLDFTKLQFKIWNLLG